jgi:hypothetical protein
MTTNVEIINIKKFINGEKAVSSDDGDILFIKIEQLIKEKIIVELDFAEITIMTTAFLNSAIGQLYSEFKSDELNRFIRLINVQEEDALLFKKVISRAKEFFANKDDFESSANDTIYGR